MTWSSLAPLDEGHLELKATQGPSDHDLAMPVPHQGARQSRGRTRPPVVQHTAHVEHRRTID